MNSTDESNGFVNTPPRTLAALILWLLLAAPLLAGDPIVNVTNQNSGLAAVQQIVQVGATTKDCVLTMPLDGTMVGKTIKVILAAGSTHHAILSWSQGDTGNGSNSPYHLSVGGLSVTFMGTPTASPLGNGDWKLVPDPYAIPPAPNILSATANVVYTPWANATYYSFSGSVNLPMSDHNYSHLKRIHILWTPVGGPAKEIDVLTSPFSSNIFAGPIPAILQGTTSLSGTVTFLCENDVADVTANPFTIQLIVASSRAALVLPTTNLEFTTQLGLPPFPPNRLSLLTAPLPHLHSRQRATRAGCPSHH